MQTPRGLREAGSCFLSHNARAPSGSPFVLIIAPKFHPFRVLRFGGGRAPRATLRLPWAISLGPLGAVVREQIHMEKKQGIGSMGKSFLAPTSTIYITIHL